MRVFTSCDRQPKPLTINKTEIDADSYFEMFMLYYCQLLIQKDKGDKYAFLQPSRTYYNINKANIVTIHQQ